MRKSYKNQIKHCSSLLLGTKYTVRASKNATSGKAKRRNQLSVVIDAVCGSILVALENWKRKPTLLMTGLV